MKAVDLSTNDVFQRYLELAGVSYRNMATTDLRFPADDEIGNELITYKKTEDGFTQEASNVIKPFDVVARNDEVIGQHPDGKPVYNEWLIDSAIVRKNYGDEAMESIKGKTDFTPHSKLALVKAVELTPELYAELSDGADGDVLPLAVSWSDEPMLAHVGDYLTDGGYSISKHNMGIYEPVEDQADSFQEQEQPALAASEPSKSTGMRMGG